LYLAHLAGGGGFWNAEKGTMKESVPQEEELMGDEGTDELGDPAATAAEEDESSDEVPSPGRGDAAGAAKDLEELNDRHLRLVAEFNNFRRRTEQERLSAWARAQADVVAKFLDVLDDLHRVAQLDLSNATVEAIMEGIDLVERKFTRMLEDSGVEVIDPAGQGFDPERMEAVMRVPAESDDQDDVVAQVFQKGYTLKGVLVRPARVSVFKQS
jgi:molecular chaperone GrpE